MVSKLLLACSLALLAGGPASAQERTLTIASWAPPTHVVNEKMWPEFIRRIEEISGGALTAEVKLNLAPPPAMADLVLDGAADITYIFHGYNPGRFVTSQLVELPGADGGAEATSVAYWRVWDKYLKAAGEQDEFKTLGMFMHGPAQFHLDDRIKSIDAISGMKIRAPGGVGSQVIEGLGAVGIQVPATKVYETLSSGAADGVVMNIDSRSGFRLDEVAPVMFEIPGGVFRGSLAILMNRDTWNSLPPELQAKLDEELVGEPLSRMFGRYWEEGDEASRDKAVQTGNLVEASVEDMAKFTSVAKRVEEAVVESVAQKGIDARAALAAFRAEAASVSQASKQ